MQACPGLKILGAGACEKAFDPPRCAKPNLAAAMRLSRKPWTPRPYFTGAGRDAARDRGTPWTATGAAALAIVMMADKCIDHRICRFARSAFIPGKRRGSFDAIVWALHSKRPAIRQRMPKPQCLLAVIFDDLRAGSGSSG